MIQAAVIGTGNISGSHIEGLLTFPERCRIAALVDIYPEKAEAARKKYHLEEPISMPAAASIIGIFST